ncbi:hypothetical protein ACWEKT_37155 [Nocardia takedensis]
MPRYHHRTDLNEHRRHGEQRDQRQTPEHRRDTALTRPILGAPIPDNPASGGPALDGRPSADPTTGEHVSDQPTCGGPASSDSAPARAIVGDQPSDDPICGNAPSASPFRGQRSGHLDHLGIGEPVVRCPTGSDADMSSSSSEGSTINSAIGIGPTSQYSAASGPTGGGATPSDSLAGGVR